MQQTDTMDRILLGLRLKVSQQKRYGRRKHTINVPVWALERLLDAVVPEVNRRREVSPRTIVGAVVRRIADDQGFRLDPGAGSHQATLRAAEHEVADLLRGVPLLDRAGVTAHPAAPLVVKLDPESIQAVALAVATATRVKGRKR